MFQPSFSVSFFLRSVYSVLPMKLPYTFQPTPTSLCLTQRGHFFVTGELVRKSGTSQGLSGAERLMYCCC